MYNRELIRLVRNCETAYIAVESAKLAQNDIKYHYWMNSLIYNIHQIEKILNLVDGIIAAELAVSQELYERAEWYLNLVK